MKALLWDKPEGYHVGTAPKPTLSAGQLIVRVHAVGLNPADVKMPTFAPVPPHAVLGFDAAGTVESVGPDVHDFAVGDRVAYCSRLVTAQGIISGSFAELQAVDAEIVAKVPAGVSFADAAAFPCAGLTALMGLKRAHTRAGDDVVVIGAAGGVGGFAVQIAKHIGCRVIAVCSKDSVAHVRNLGATDCIDYHTENTAERVKELTAGRGCDVVFDAVGPQSAGDVFKMLAPHGQLVCAVGMPDASKSYPMFSLGISIHELMLVCAPKGDKRAHELAVLGDELFQLVANGKVRSMICETTTMEGIPTALAKVGGGHVHGKIVAVFVQH